MQREQILGIAKIVGKITLNALPGVLAAIPVTQMAGKILKEMKTATEAYAKEMEKSAEKEAELAKKLEKIMNENGGPKAVMSELQENCCKSGEVNCVSFVVVPGKEISDEVKQSLKEWFAGEIEFEDENVNTILEEFAKIYFRESIAKEDYEIGDSYVNFNFCEYDEFEYSEELDEDMQYVMKALNEIAGEELIGAYFTFGPDDV